MSKLIPWVLLTSLIIPIGAGEFTLLRKGHKQAIALGATNILIGVYSWYRIIWAKQPLITGLYGLATSITGIILAIFAALLLIVSGYLVSRPKGAWDANPQALITMGPYRFARHPAYAGEFLLIFSIALGKRAIWAIFLSPTFLILALCASSLEEEYILTKNFLDLYDQYRQDVPRFFPWWGSLLIASIYLKTLIYYLIWRR